MGRLLLLLGWRRRWHPIVRTASHKDETKSHPRRFCKIQFLNSSNSISPIQFWFFDIVISVVFVAVVVVILAAACAHGSGFSFVVSVWLGFAAVSVRSTAEAYLQCPTQSRNGGMCPLHTRHHHNIRSTHSPFSPLSQKVLCGLSPFSCLAYPSCPSYSCPCSVPAALFRQPSYFAGATARFRSPTRYFPASAS